MPRIKLTLTFLTGPDGRTYVEVEGVVAFMAAAGVDPRNLDSIRCCAADHQLDEMDD